MIAPLSILNRITNVSNKVVEKIKTRYLVNYLFFSGYHAFYEIMWEKIVEPDRPQMTIWFLRIVC